MWLLLAARFVRMLAFGSSSLILALFLSDIGLSPVEVGSFLTSTLVGDFFLSLVLTFVADNTLGRRNTLRLGAISMIISGVVFATTNNTKLLLVAAIFGVVSPSGGEIGPFKAVEESILAGLVPKEDRPHLFGWYVVIGSLAASLATFLGGWLNEVVNVDGGSNGGLMAYYRWVFLAYAVLGCVKLLLSLALSKRCEPRSRRPVSPPQAQSNEATEREPLLSHTQAAQASASDPEVAATTPAEQTFGLGRFAGLCLLFAIDSFGSGMATQSITSWFLSRKFSTDLSSIGSVISAALLVSSVSNLFSASLAKRLGLVQTMVLTHLPSSILLALLPLPSSLAWASTLIVGRALTSGMDQAPRSAFMSAFVPDHHRTRVLGLVNTVKTLAQSAGPTLTGWLTDQGHMGWAFHLAGGLKAGYDLGLLAAFSTVR